MEPNDQMLIGEISRSLGRGELEKCRSVADLKQELPAYINHLITSDFNKLVQLLYRLDVSETKLKKMLAENAGTDAGLLVSELIIDRQLQKLRTRANFRQPGENNIGDDEKW